MFRLSKKRPLSNTTPFDERSTESAEPAGTREDPVKLFKLSFLMLADANYQPLAYARIDTEGNGETLAINSGTVEHIIYYDDEYRELFRGGRESLNMNTYTIPADSRIRLDNLFLKL